VRGAKQLLTAAGKAYRQKGWWTSGNDKLVAYYKDLVVWINGKDTFQAEMVDRLESHLTSKSGKDQPAQNSVGHEDRYWAGTEAGLLNIPEFKGIIYATDGSLSSEGMGAPGHGKNVAGGLKQDLTFEDHKRRKKCALVSSLIRQLWHCLFRISILIYFVFQLCVSI